MEPPASVHARRRRLFLFQGLYYAATGIWPLLHRFSFERVTGPKTDFWLVRTIGALLTVVGGTMVTASARPRPGPEVALLSIGSAAALAAIDTHYAVRGRISKVYLLDAAAEAALVAAWCTASREAGAERVPNTPPASSI